DSAEAARKLRDVMCDAASLFNSVRDRNGQLRTLHQRNIRHVVADESHFLFINLNFREEFLKIFDLVPRALSHIFHPQLTRSAFDKARGAPRNDPRLKSGAMQEHEAVTVSRVK